MSMTKQDYALIANAVKSAMDLEEARHSAAVQGCRAVAETLAATFKLNHERFDIAKFINACGLSPMRQDDLNATTAYTGE